MGPKFIGQRNADPHSEDAMQSTAPQEHVFPRRFRIQGRTVTFRLLDDESRDRMVAFARALPEEDLLFLDRDITDPTTVDKWIRLVEQGSLVTIVAWQDDAIVGYASFERGHVRWTQHVAELRVVVAQAARGLGVGRLLLETVFEMALSEGVMKVIARMTPDQTGARALFERLGFEEEAVLRDNALDATGRTHDLLVLRYRVRLHQEQKCTSCGVPVLAALSLDGVQLCSHCFELQYEELGGEG